LLKSESLAIGITSEMLLYMAARAQLVEEIVRPSLDAGRTVVSDRFLLSNVVYQGHAGGLDPETLWRIGQTATGGILPALTFVLDLPPEVAGQRMRRELDRMESRGEAYRAALRRGFLDEATKQPASVAVIDASRSIETVQSEIRAAAATCLAKVNA
jgi:dTMP kinase